MCERRCDVAKFVNLEDPFQNAAVEILETSKLQTNIEAGDGTTTATVLLDQSSMKDSDTLLLEYHLLSSKEVWIRLAMLLLTI